MRLLLITSLFLIISCTPKDGNNNASNIVPIEKWPTKEWKYKSFAKNGIDSSLVYSINDSINQNHSLLIIHNGSIIYESYQAPYLKDSLIHINSCTKSVISMLFGMVFKDSLIKHENKHVFSYFPEYHIQDTLLQKIKVKHFLSMSSGLDWKGGVDATDIFGMTNTKDWSFYVLNKKVIHAPNEIFNYNSGGTQVVTAILQKEINSDLVEYAQDSLFNPLGINDIKWDKTPLGHPKAGWGLHMKMEDMAKLGYLMLNNGKWKEKQIISEDWINRATTSKINKNKEWNYGYQFWIPTDLEFKSYFFKGYYPPARKRIVVIPDLNIIAVYVGEYGNFKEIVKRFIIPTFSPKKPSL